MNKAIKPKKLTVGARVTGKLGKEEFTGVVKLLDAKQGRCTVETKTALPTIGAKVFTIEAHALTVV